MGAHNFMQFLPNGRSSKWNLNGVRLMIVFQTEIKMAGINRKLVFAFDHNNYTINFELFRTKLVLPTAT